MLQRNSELEGQELEQNNPPNPILMTLRAAESIGGVENGRWEENEDREQASAASTAKHPNAVGGCPQGTVSAIGPHEFFSV